MLTQEAKQAVSGPLGQMAGGFKAICDRDTKNGQILAVDVLSEEIRGEGATVVVNIRFRDGTEKDNDRNGLMFRQGRWLLTAGE